MYFKTLCSVFLFMRFEKSEWRPFSRVCAWMLHRVHARTLANAVCQTHLKMVVFITHSLDHHIFIYITLRVVCRRRHNPDKSTIMTDLHRLRRFILKECLKVLRTRRQNKQIEFIIWLQLMPCSKLGATLRRVGLISREWKRRSFDGRFPAGVWAYRHNILAGKRHFPDCCAYTARRTSQRRR